MGRNTNDDVDIEKFYNRIYEIVFKAVKDAIMSVEKSKERVKEEKVAEYKLRNMFDREFLGKEFSKDNYKKVVRGGSDIGFLTFEQLDDLNKIGGING